MQSVLKYYRCNLRPIYTTVKFWHSLDTKMVRVPKNVAWVHHLHVSFSTVPATVKIKFLVSLLELTHSAYVELFIQNSSLTIMGLHLFSSFKAARSKADVFLTAKP